MTDTPIPFVPHSRDLNPPLLKMATLPVTQIQHLAALRVAARRWYALRPQYAKSLRRPEVCAAWAAFEAAVLTLDPDTRFDFGDTPGDHGAAS